MRHNNFNTSLLNKNYDFIYETINRNIGSVDYQQDYGNSMGNVVTTDLYNPLSKYVSVIRNNFANYIDYAQSLNPELVFFNSDYPINFFGQDILKTSTKSYLYDNYLSSMNGFNLKSTIEDIIYAADVTNDEIYNVAYDKLKSTSDRYISYVNDLLNRSNVNGEYQYGIGNVNGVEVEIPHQLTRGYSYASLKGDVHDGISVINNISSVYDLDVKFNTPFYTFVMDWNTDHPTRNDSNLNDDIVGTENIDNINTDYGYKLENGKGYETLFNAITNNDYIVRYTIDTKTLFVNAINQQIIKVYNEAYDENSPLEDTELTYNFGIDSTIGLNGLHYSSFGDWKNKNDLLAETNRQFRHGKYKTMIAKFGSYAQGNGSKETVLENEYDVYHTAVSSYGTSHGRNLLRSKENRQVSHFGGKTYNDPYCRVWTNYHQYSHYRNLIRPFMEESEDSANLISSNKMYYVDGFDRVRTESVDGFDNGQIRLRDYGVMQGNNFVNITPKINQGGDDFEVKTKQCMFSIENLAWKGAWMKNQERNGLSKEQQGPFGGRIMWFPPYGLTFSENVTANWSNTTFIGRGEPIYTYTDTTRSGTLNFTLLIDHPSIMNEFQNNTGSDQFLQNDDEHAILRFFAGCDFPTLKEKRPQNKEKEEEEQKDPPKPMPDNPTKSKGEFSFAVYFPNNYSGINDINNIGDKGGVDPMTYLINGIAAQQQATFNQNGAPQISDIPTDARLKNYISATTTIGYEINGYNKTETDNGVTSGVSWYNYKDLKDSKYVSLASPCEVKGLSYKLSVTFKSVTATTYSCVNKAGQPFTKTEIVDSKGNKSATYVPSVLIDKTENNKKLISSTTYISEDKSTITMTSSGNTTYYSCVEKTDINDKKSLLADKTPIVPKTETIPSKNLSSRTTIKNDKATNRSVIAYNIKMISQTGVEYFYKLSKTIDFNIGSVPADMKYETSGNIDLKTTSEMDLNIYPITSVQYSDSKTPTRWWYRIDVGKESKGHKYENQVLLPEGYIDRRDFGLNSSKGLENIVKKYANEYYKVKKPENMYAFTEVFIATNKNKEKVKENLSGLYNEKNIDALTNILKGKKITDIEVRGFASIHGYTDSNKDLANNRKDVLRKWCEHVFGIEAKGIDLEEGDSSKPTTQEVKDESELLAKMGRCAVATVYYSLEDVKEKSKDTDSKVFSGNTVLNPTYSSNTSNYDIFVQKATYMVKNKFTIAEGNDGHNARYRYDNEYEFFKKIDANDSFIKNKIIDKVKYFDPAYHSITPEGFNSRLTFLHQCTRQGPTCGNSEIDGKNITADNLAFGRQPVCILRVGDFYNTKIVINSMSISYDKNGINWDLNSEGIGLQPMYAEISLSFTFLGGSDLAGPIARLQNAVSFNYYANTGVYDNRSEMVEYTEDGELKNYRTYNPLSNKNKK